MGKVLSAQGTGYYPSCIKTGSAPDSQFNLDLTIEQGMALYWRTRKWSFVASGSWISNNYGIQQNVSGSGEFENVDPIVTSEEQLLCLGDYGYFASFTTDQDTFDIEWAFVLDLTPPFASYKSETNFYPYFRLNSTFVQSNNSREDQKIGTLRLNFNGYIISKNLYTDTASFPYDGTSGNVLIDITCIEYWSYDGTWNTSTGELLTP